MIATLLKRVVLLSALTVAGMSVSGCGVSLHVVKYPDFWQSDSTYSSIAVAHVTNASAPGAMEYEAGQTILSDLVYNGSYTVYDHTNDRINDTQLLNNVMERHEADLVLYSTINGISDEGHPEDRVREERRPVYKRDSAGHEMRDANGNLIVDHFEFVKIPYRVFVASATADIDIHLYTTTNGSLLYNSDVTGRCTYEGPGPRDVPAPPERIDCATKKAAGYVASKVMPYSSLTSIQGKYLLGLYNSASKRTSSYSAGETITISTTMNDKARLNSFHIDIVAKKTEVPLTEYDVYWEGSTINQTFNVDDLVNAAGGVKDFTARFWNRGKVVYKADFSVKE